MDTISENPQKKKTYFNSQGLLTVGVEIELQLLDSKTYNLLSCAEEILKETQEINKVKPEFYLSSLEVNTDKCENIHLIEKDLSQTLQELQQTIQHKNILLAATGSHPFSVYKDWHISSGIRYENLIKKTGWLAQQMCVFGMHIHLGMENGDKCIRFQNFFTQFLPHLLALSASSPFWQGIDTGLLSCRPATYEALPTAGQGYAFNNWHDFETFYDTLVASRAINSLKDLWWDIRPSPALGTLEIRICDGIATLSETMAITAFIHLLAYWFEDNQMHPYNYNISSWIYRENKWRAMRYGLDAELIINLQGETRLIKEEITNWIERLTPYIEKYHYKDYIGCLKNIIHHGNSSSRQKKIFEKTHSLKNVVQHNVDEFLKQRP